MSRYVTVHVACDRRDCSRCEEVRGASVGACKKELRRRGWALGKLSEDCCANCRSRGAECYASGAALKKLEWF